MTVLVTGAAGFIGSATCLALLARGERVVGLDNMSPYYDVRLKRDRLARHFDHPAYTHVEADLADRGAVERVFAEHNLTRVVNLAAQAGVRHASKDPHSYIASNVTGFLHVLEGCRHGGVEHLVYASTSSVYGANTTTPFSEHHAADHPLSLYSATKKADEMMAHAYAHLFALPCTGLRFFTVYGPWGRPDMALFLFTRAILAGEPLRVFNGGRHRRDFTYVDDIVEGILRTLDLPPTGDPAWDGAAPDPAASRAPWRVYNIGAGRPVELMRYIQVLETELGRKATLEFLPLQPGDVPDTDADVTALERDVGYRPTTTVEAGVARFVAWYRDYYSV